MANRRMFSKSITNSSGFLMMPQSSQNLYFHLGMNADDDGFCEHFTLMRMTDSKPDDLKVLQAKGFVKVFDDKVLVVNNWKENNYIQKDRYTPSKYLEIYKEELKQLANENEDRCIQNVSKMDTQVRLGKDRIGKDSIISYAKKDKELTDFLYEKVKLTYPRSVEKKTKIQFEKDYEEMSKINKIDKWNYEQIRYVIEWSQADNFWHKNIRSVKKLREQFERLVAEIKSRGEKNRVVKI